LRLGSEARHPCTSEWCLGKGDARAERGLQGVDYFRFDLASGFISALLHSMRMSPIRNRKQECPVPDELADFRHQLAIANRVLANEGVLDAFGHVSARHPRDPNRYLLSRSRSPGLIEAADVLEFTLDSEPVRPSAVQLYAERVIHGCIYQARSDVMAVCHHHAPAVMPFCIAGIPIVPVFHLGAAAGETVPFWNQREEFGDTNLLVIKPQEGASLARALGRHGAVLMNNHGATVVGTDLREMVSRAIFMCQNAEYQLKARILGGVKSLTPGETRLAATLNALPNVTNRTWEYWTLRLQKSGELPRRASSVAKSEAQHRDVPVTGESFRTSPGRKSRRKRSVR
jgi:ribulose-5-phosphate 4-epimerase/fuculose-1-phosphate aldolase